MSYLVAEPTLDAAMQMFTEDIGVSDIYGFSTFEEYGFEMANSENSVPTISDNLENIACENDALLKNGALYPTDPLEIRRLCKARRTMRDISSKEVLDSQGKLLLFVDLDKTLIDSTSREIDSYKPQPGIHRVNYIDVEGLFNKIKTQTVKLRPHVRLFLEKASAKYELCLVSLGLKEHVEIVADILDPYGSLFYGRIFSRDDIKSGNKRDAMLGFLSHGYSNVVILDDSRFPWDYCDNVLHIDPYCYFADFPKYDDRYNSGRVMQRQDDSDASLVFAIIVLHRIAELYFFISRNGDSCRQDRLLCRRKKCSFYVNAAHVVRVVNMYIPGVRASTSETTSFPLSPLTDAFNRHTNDRLIGLIAAQRRAESAAFDNNRAA